MMFSLPRICFSRTLQGSVLCAFLLIIVGTSASGDRLHEGYEGGSIGERVEAPSDETQISNGEGRWRRTTHEQPGSGDRNFRALCDKPVPPENGYIKGHNYSYEAVVTIGCEPGYVLHGPSNITCLPVPFHGAPGIWVPQDEYQCLPKTGMTTSNVFDDDAFDDNGQPYSEDSQHLVKLSQDNQRGFPDVRCPMPTAPANGEVMGTDYSMGATVTYSCDEGFSLIGPNHATCLPVPDPFHHVAIWDPPTLPSCQVPAAPPCLLQTTAAQVDTTDTAESGFNPRLDTSAHRLTDTLPNSKDIEGLPSLCSLPQDSGPCREAIPRYFFDAATQECRPFTYGGCLGNENNFDAFETCQSTCR